MTNITQSVYLHRNFHRRRQPLAGEGREILSIWPLKRTKSILPPPPWKFKNSWGALPWKSSCLRPWYFVRCVVIIVKTNKRQRERTANTRNDSFWVLKWFKFGQEQLLFFYCAFLKNIQAQQNGHVRFFSKAFQQKECFKLKRFFCCNFKDLWMWTHGVLSLYRSNCKFMFSSECVGTAIPGWNILFVWDLWPWNEWPSQLCALIESLIK